jgi:hypothetical protein
MIFVVLRLADEGAPEAHLRAWTTLEVAPGFARLRGLAE